MRVKGSLVALRSATEKELSKATEANRPSVQRPPLLCAIVPTLRLNQICFLPL